MDESQQFRPELLTPQEAIAALGKIAIGVEPLAATLLQVARLAKQTILDIDEVSMTLVERDHPRTVVFTGKLAVDLDERQYEAGRGPCTDAAVAGETIIVYADDPKAAYPEFAAAMRRAGVRHSLSVGLPFVQTAVGAVNTYSFSPGPVAATSVKLVEAFADYAGVACSNAARYADAAAQVEQMKRAMDSRAVIEQAKGVVIAQSECTEAEAFGILVKHSQTTNRKLKDVAADIVKDAQRQDA